MGRPEQQKSQTAQIKTENPTKDIDYSLSRSEKHPDMLRFDKLISRVEAQDIVEHSTEAISGAAVPDEVSE